MKKKAKSPRTWRQELALIARGYKILYKMCPPNVVWRIINCISQQLSPYFSLFMSAFIIDKITEGADFDTLLFLALITVAGQAFLSILVHFVNWKAWVYEEIQWQRNKLYMINVENKMQYKYLEDPETTSLYGKIEHFTNYGGNGLMLLYWNIWFVVRSVFNIIASVALTFSMFTMVADNPAGGFVAFANSPISAILLAAVILANIVIQAKIANVQSTKNNKLRADVSLEYKRANDYLYWHHGADTKIYGMKELCLSRSKKYYVKPDCEKKQINNNFKYGTITTVWNAVMNTFLFAYIGAKAFAGAFGIGSFVLYRGTVEKFIEAVSTLGSRLGRMKDNNNYLVQLFSYLDLPDEMYHGTLSVEKRDDNKYEIEFRDVSFKYPGANEYALKNVSFRFRIGERLAFVGMNGSGKTTFIKLLTRLYDPTEGTILLNGIDITRYKYDEYIALFSVVFQDFSVFCFDIKGNVSASVDCDRERVEACLRKAGLGEKIDSLEKGIDTYVSKQYDTDGLDLSGGEKQKVALARALYKNAPFIILDEPTAALDPLAEAEIYGKFNEIAGDRTTIYISHRLSSCRFCDSIVVFDNGEIIQHGTHETLIEEATGKYRELWHAQAQYYSDKQ